MFIFYQSLTFILYPIFILFYFISSNFRDFIKIRREEKKRIKTINHKSLKTLWFHSASVGELEQAKALALEYEKLEPNTFIIHSVFSQSVEIKHLQNKKNRFFFHLPLDFYNAYNFILEKFKPQVLVIFAWDTWTNLILSSKRYNVKTVLACGVLSKRAKFPYSIYFSKLFQKFDLILLSDSIFLSKFHRLNIRKNIHIGGDTRFDSVITKIKNSKDLMLNIEHKSLKKVLILASTYLDCEKLWVPLLKESFLEEYIIWIFPHKIDKDHLLQIENLLKKYNLEFDYFSKNLEKAYFSKKIVIFNLMGILAFAYKYAHIVYVGGALHNKVHNTIEPAYFGCPILFGPKFHNAPEAIQLHKQNTAFSVSSKNSIESAIFSIEKNYPSIVEKNQEFVVNNQGSSKRIYDFIEGMK